MKTIPDRKRVTVRYHHLTDQHSPLVTSIYIDRHWCNEFRVYTRNDTTGIWDYKNVADPLPADALKPRSAKIIPIPVNNEKVANCHHRYVQWLQWQQFHWIHFLLIF